MQEAKHSTPEANKAWKGPGCGMEVNPESAFAERDYRKTHYYFCSTRCVEQFQATLRNM